MASGRRVLSFLVCLVVCSSWPSAQSGQFTDDTLTPAATPVRVVHLTELRARINAARTAAQLPEFSFTDPVLVAGATPVRAAHVTELRTAVTQVYQALGQPLPAFPEAIQSGATPIRAAHIAELRAAVVALESGLPNDGEDPGLSSAGITLAGVAERTFNSVSATVRFDIANGQFSVNPDHVQVFHRGQIVDPVFVQITSAAVTVTGMLRDGPNEIELAARDAAGRYIDFSATVWAGSAELRGMVVDGNGTPLPVASVRAGLAIDQTVGQTVTTSPDGAFIFTNVPEWSVVLEASAGSRHGSITVRGNAPEVTLRAPAIGAPSPVANNDFSMGTNGWDVGTAPVEIIPHAEGSPAAISTAAETDFDLKLTTGGVEGPQRVSRTFSTKPGIRNVKVRYRFVTSEVPGGFFGTEFDDAFTVSVRSDGGGRISESASMNSLGLGAFDAQGATTWRETRLPVSITGDVVRVDVGVANVADNLLDSYVVIDAVSETNLALSDVELKDIDDSPLEFLSVGASHSYFGGKTRIHGSLSLQMGEDDTAVTITLDIIQNGTVVAFAGFVGPAVPNRAQASDPPEFEFEGLLFELSSEQAAKIDVSEDGTVLLVARARSSNGNQSIFPVGKVSLLSRYTGDNRFGTRNGDVGGDDWAQPGMVALASHFSGNRYGDFSNMNGGDFPPHSGHKTGDAVDGWFPGYNARDATSAATLIDRLNDPLYGSRIARVLVTFEKTTSNPFWNAIRNVVLADGRRASDVIHPAPGYQTHFHWERATGDEPGAEVSAAAAERRRMSRR